jgi:hypothetical protein
MFRQCLFMSIYRQVVPWDAFAEILQPLIAVEEGVDYISTTVATAHPAKNATISTAVVL